MFSLRALIAHLKQMKGYFAFGTILFFAGMIVGGTNPALDAFITGQLKGLEQIADSIDKSSNPSLMMFVFIFFNNAIKSILIMYLGMLFGIVPIFFLIVNGMVLGYLFTNLAENQGAGMLVDVIVKGILPHGIIEIPAIIIASAYGIKFGTLALRGAGSVLTRKKGIGLEFETFATRTVPVMVLLVGLLLVAAGIESTFTMWLMSNQ
jgi:stage II sporulation protein M